MNALLPVAVTVRAADLNDERERARLDAFVAERADGTIFHRPDWSRMVEAGCGQKPLFLVAECGGRLVGCLPLTAIRSRLFGNALVSVGFATGGGILAESAQAATRLAEAAWAAAQRERCQSVELRGGPLPEGFVARQGVYARFDRSLPGDAEALMKSLPRRQRAEVRRAQRQGLEVIAGSDSAFIDGHFRAYSEGVRNLGSPVFPRRLFQAALTLFGPDADICLARQGDAVHATMLNFYFKGACLPFWGGGTEQARVVSGNDLVWYETMRRAIARGCTRADFGRSKVGTGPWRRKQIWGFDEHPLDYRLRTVDGTRGRDINPLSAGNRLKVEAWKRMPLWAANRLGPLLARGLG